MTHRGSLNLLRVDSIKEIVFLNYKHYLYRVEDKLLLDKFRAECQEAAGKAKIQYLSKVHSNSRLGNITVFTEKITSLIRKLLLNG